MPPLLLDREVNKCNCDEDERVQYWSFEQKELVSLNEIQREGFIKSTLPFTSLDEFISICNGIRSSDLECLPKKYKKPVIRQYPFTLFQITKSFVGNQLKKDQIDKLEIPNVLKSAIMEEPFQSHSHFKIAINEKMAKSQWFYGYDEHFAFEIEANTWKLVWINSYHETSD